MNGNGPTEGTPATAGGPWTLPGYTHERELGSGASGRVLLARHDTTGTPVAVKYLSDAVGDTTAFRTEATLLGDLRSPYVAELYEYVESAHGAAIVMELVDGIALRTLLRQEGATGPEAALAVLKGSLLGLAAAHAAGVVHRDYKPGNVLIAADGSSKLVDFGIAVRSGDTPGIAGTPVYMAPEQWTGAPASPSADVYAATATFFECLTGAKPYSGDTLVELAVQHTEAPIPAELAPEAVRSLIRSGLAKSPADRPQSAAALVEELERVAGAAYGADWEERGRRTLAAVVALLPLLLPSAGGAAAGSTSLATTTLAGTTVAPSGAVGAVRRRPRLGRRARVLTGTVAVGVLAGTSATIAVADGAAGASGSASVAPAAQVTTLLAPSTDPGTASPSPSASPSASASVSASASAAPSATAAVSPTATAARSAVAVATKSPQPAVSSPVATVAAGPTGSAPAPSASAPPASPPPAAPSSPAAPPSSAAGHVLSVSIDGYGCAGPYGATVSVTVRTDGGAGTALALSWVDGGRGGRADVVGTQVVNLQPGQTQLTGRFTHFFGYGDDAPFWGVAVATSPTADAGQGSYQQIPSYLCNPPR
ncbi:protein kinase [Kitasatospora sp. NPDC052896]|uniref:protein kinase domain-containing protein n=1 Tax=Kitasatospora sp. NPDC052896 TaxID=3364061 RepID=UPI0037CBAC94